MVSIKLLCTTLLVFSLAACNFFVKGKLESQADDAKNSESIPTESAVISANSTETQKLKGSGATEGVTVSFPPGSLAVDAPVSIEAAGDLSSDALSELGLSASVTQVGAAIIVDTSSDTDPVGSFALELPTPVNAGLVQSEGFLFVVYRIVIKATGEYRTGLIPSSEFTSFVPGNGVVTISTNYFGQFQTVYLDIAITENIEVKSVTEGFLDAAGDVKKSATKTQPDTSTTSATPEDTTIADTTKPIVELATSAPAYTSLAAIEFEATASEGILGFTADDISTSSGSVAGFTKVNNTYKFSINSPAEGELTVFVKPDAVKNAAGNLSNKSNTVQVTVDRTPPLLAITTTPGSFVNSNNASSFSIAGTCSEIGKNTPFTGANSPSTTPCLAGGTFDKLIDVGTNLGIRIIQAEIEDEAGNLSTSQLNIHVIESLTVLPKYSVAPDWMDHVQTADTDAACVGTETSLTARTACVDGGPLRKFVVAGESDCADLIATDNLNLFTWLCKDDGPTVHFQGILREELGLRDLIVATGNAFKHNYVSVSKSSVLIGASNAASWWSNTFEVLTSSVSTISLTEPSRIYTFTSDEVVPKVAFDADKVALVVMPNAFLKIGPLADYNCAGSPGNATLNTTCLVYVGGQNFARVEGDFRNDVLKTASVGVLVKDSRFVTVASADMLGFGNDGYGKGLRVAATYGFIGRNLRIKETDGKGFGLENVDYAALEDIFVSNSTDGAGGVLNGTHGVIRRATLAGSSWQNLKIETANHWTVSEVIAVGSGNTTYGIGMDYYYNDWLVVQGATVALHKKTGVQLNRNTHFVMHGILSFNNQEGFSAVGGPPESTDLRANKLADVLSTDSYILTDEHLAGTTVGTPTFLQELVSGSACNLSAFAGPPSCTVITGQSAAFSAPTAGTTASATDFFNVNNRWSHWGFYGSPTASDASNRGWCFNTDECQQYDWRVGSGPNSLAYANGTFIAGAACPVVGSQTFNGPDGPVLQFANEILFDESGNDNGLCEANETCVFMPHFGGYQGEGGYTSSCLFSDAGGIAGVTLLGYQTTHR